MLLQLDPLTPTERLLLLLLCAAGIALALWFVFSRLARFRLIADTPTARIRSAPQGYVELIGQVIAGEDGLLRAPLSGRPCVWFDYRIEERQDHDGRSRWRHVRSGRSSQWFQISDGTGTCLIDPDGAEVSTRHRHSWHGHSSFPSGSELDPLGAAAFFRLQLGNGRYRFTERLIVEHEPLYALGHFQTVGGGRDRLDPHATVRDLLRDWKRDPDQLLARFDSNGDGRISPDEWQSARQAAAQEAAQQQLALQQLPSMHVLSDPQSARLPYLLSTHDEAQLMRRYRWLSAGCFLAALTLFWLFLEILLAN